CTRPLTLLEYPAGRADTALPARVGCRPLLQGPVLLPVGHPRIRHLHHTGSGSRRGRTCQGIPRRFQEREFTLYPVTIAYEDIATDNLITSANIAKIIEVEKSLLSIDWKDRCVLAYLDEDQKPKDAYCRSPTTLLNYLHVNNDKHQ
ncbi:hypothetical protein T492DRAFT_903606, partial [Pavlovales sp. CCMP2436]